MIPKGAPKHNPTMLLRFVFTAVVAVFVFNTGSIAADLDETMPGSIPAEIKADWQDQGGTAAEIKASLPEEYQAKCDGSFESACHWRRVYRMKLYPELQHFIFAKHHNFGGFVVGYHDNVDGSTSDDNWQSKSALCEIKMTNYYPEYKEILKKDNAVIRDPCIHFNGKKMLLAISGGSSKGSGYDIYEMEIDDPSTLKKITSNPEGLTVADFEPCYLPNGDIAFTSTRNFGLTDCAMHPTTNMFMMDSIGRYIRQVGFDQVHTFYPQMMEDGTVLYTRWEYNDRDVTNNMGLFIMNPDGSHQIEYFGNQTSWPMTIIHARQIPGTQKIMACAGGHHAPYQGELMIIDPFKGKTGFNGKECVTMVAPIRDTKPDANKSDVGAGGVYFNFQTPYPLDEEWCLVSWRKKESEKIFKLYFMNVSGERELIAWGDQSVSQPVLVREWEPDQLPEQANYNDSMGTVTMQDVYYGEGTKGIDKASGAAVSLRVVKLSYRVQGSSGMGSVFGSAPSGAFQPAVMVPIAAYGASWEAKTVLGEAKIHKDGSAAFKVPARQPIYFQVIDTNGYCMATMRSWATLMPGETFSCIGCHENRLLAPPAGGTPLAGDPKKAPNLEKPLGIEEQPFDYGELVQPILDEHCADCHKSGHASGFDLSGGMSGSFTRSYSSLLKGIGAKTSNKAINICTIFSHSEQYPPYSFGSSQSGMMKNIKEGHKDVKLSDKEAGIIACWIDLAAPHAGKYDSYLSSSKASQYQELEKKRLKWQEIEAKNLEELAKIQATALNPESHLKATSFKEQLSIGFIPATRALILKSSSQGSFKLLDLRGRVIFRMNLAKEKAGRDVNISLPKSLATGLYLARFEGVDGMIQQAKISVTQ